MIESRRLDQTNHAAVLEWLHGSPRGASSAHLGGGIIELDVESDIARPGDLILRETRGDGSENITVVRQGLQ